MARRRFFVHEVREGRAEISGDDAHHLSRVLRVEPGQQYELADSRQVWLATVETVSKTRVIFQIDQELEAGPPLPDVTLYLALFRFERFEWAVEKATELGVTRIVPVNAARSEQGLVQAARKRVERWRRIAAGAGEQSRRLAGPEILEVMAFSQAVQTQARHRLWLDENDRANPLLQTIRPLPGESTALMVGPEGGWTAAERDAFAAAGWKSASLGPHILRAETAVCAALAVFAQLAMLPSVRPFTIEAADALQS